MNKSNTIAVTQNIHKSYVMGKEMTLQVLSGVDLSLNSGEIIAIIGPSGVGKSTLLHIIGGLDRPTEGSVSINGHELSKMKDHELAAFRNKHVGFVFQFHHLMPEFTALENVSIPGMIAGMDDERIKERAKELLMEIGLGSRLTHRPGELSGGEQQRVAFARSLMTDPDLILADEPSGNLDLQNSKSLHDLIWNLVKEKQKTFVVVTHNQELAERADRVIELFDGKVKD